MSSRAEAKRRAREARLERENALNAAATRRRRLWRLGTVVAIAAVVVTGAVVISQSGSNQTDAPTGGAPSGAVEVNALFAGIPQDGISLGEPDAPVTMTEFADLQCPFCAQYARDVLPGVVERYVRAGRVRLVFRALTFIGPDSDRAARAATAAGLQDRQWPFVELFYRNQGTENTGYATDAFLRRLSRAVTGLDANRAQRERTAPAVERELSQASSEAQRYGVKSTPSFLIARRGRPPQRFEPDRLELATFTARLDQELGRR